MPKKRGRAIPTLSLPNLPRDYISFIENRAREGYSIKNAILSFIEKVMKIPMPCMLVDHSHPADPLARFRECRMFPPDHQLPLIILQLADMGRNDIAHRIALNVAQGLSETSLMSITDLKTFEIAKTQAYEETVRYTFSLPTQYQCWLQKQIRAIQHSLFVTGIALLMICVPHYFIFASDWREAQPCEESNFYAGQLCWKPSLSLDLAQRRALPCRWTVSSGGQRLILSSAKEQANELHCSIEDINEMRRCHRRILTETYYIDFVHGNPKWSKWYKWDFPLRLLWALFSELQVELPLPSSLVDICWSYVIGFHIS